MPRKTKKGKPQNEKKIFSIHLSDKGHVPRIYF